MAVRVLSPMTGSVEAESIAEATRSQCCDVRKSQSLGLSQVLDQCARRRNTITQMLDTKPVERSQGKMCQ